MMAGFESGGAFFAALMSIVLIDLMLAGDNAVVIAMAVRHLPPSSRRWGIVLGSAAAVLIRVACTFLVAQLLAMQFVKMAGGIAILWIAVKMLRGDDGEGAHHPVGSLGQALMFIIVADLSMGIDNMLAVGAASHGNGFLILLGLCLSIPFIVFTSTWLARLMEQFPVILTIGAALLGKIGGEMILTDRLVQAHFTPNGGVYYGLMILSAVTVVATGRGMTAMRSRSRHRRSHRRPGLELEPGRH
jgi:YjbE family integral membrane protein